MALEIHHLTPRDYKTMPWKNGGGSTTELGIFPSDASVQQGFDWRISLADLDASGPFSTFPGYDRLIVQISGDPMLLKHQGHADKALVRYQPYSFAGEWPTEAVLHGKAQDFNVMVKRGKMLAGLESIPFESEPFRHVHKDGVTFIWVVFGSILVHESSKGHDYRLDQHHAFELRGDDLESVLTLKPREDDSVALLVTIRSA